MNQEIAIREVNLTQSQKELVALRIGNKSIKDLDRSVVAKHCAAVLVKSSFEMGSPMADDPNILEFQKNSLVDELKGKYGSMTLPEVSEAFRRGIRGESGPFFGMCPKTYHQFLKWFFELPERGKAWLAYLDEQSKVPVAEKPVFFTKDYFSNAAKTAYSEYLDYGKMPLFPFAIYDTIKELTGAQTLIEKKDWESIKKEAKTTYSNQMKSSRKKQELDFSMGNASFENIIKNIGLRRYFEKLKQEGKTLEL